jgi:hypothetical protein
MGRISWVQFILPAMLYNVIISNWKVSNNRHPTSVIVTCCLGELLLSGQITPWLPSFPLLGQHLGTALTDIYFAFHNLFNEVSTIYPLRKLLGLPSFSPSPKLCAAQWRMTPQIVRQSAQSQHMTLSINFPPTSHVSPMRARLFGKTLGAACRTRNRRTIRSGQVF